jgi:flavorubredoxin
MPSAKAIRLWAEMARSLDIETIAPQHGAVMKGPETVKKFIDWFDSLKVGVDVMEDVYKIPAG